MHLLLIEASDNSDDSSEVGVTRLEFAIDTATTAKRDASHARAAEVIKAKLRLIDEQGTAIKKWLIASSVGDTLLIEQVGAHSDPADKWAIVVCDNNCRPEITRLVVRRVQKISAELRPIASTGKK
jgi:hypothetical protein